MPDCEHFGWSHTNDGLNDWCAWCEIKRLQAELNEAADATGIAGVDEPMSLVECVRAIRAENDVLRAKLQGVLWYINRTLNGGE